MSVGTQAERIAQQDDRRARRVWAVLALCALIFVALCSLLVTALGTSLNTLTVPHTADLEPRSGSQVVVVPYHSVTRERVSSRTSLNEGDLVRTDSDDGAFLTLFDGSTVQLYFDTEIVLERMRTSRYFNNGSEVVIAVKRGTLLVATAGSGAKADSHFVVSSEVSGVEVSPDSKVRVRVEGAGSEQIMSVTLDEGGASMMSRGKSLLLKPKQLSRALGSGTLVGPLPAEEELVRNGTFTDDATSGAELIENGGLGIAAWLPVRTQAVPPIADPGVVEVVTETVGVQTTSAVRLRRSNDDSQ